MSPALFMPLATVEVAPGTSNVKVAKDCADTAGRVVTMRSAERKYFMEQTRQDAAILIISPCADGSILRRSLHFVDDEDPQRRLRRFQFQSELFAERFL